MDIGAVIVTYNNAGEIASCITSIQKHGIHSIVVVDNASEDTTRDIIQTLPIQAIYNKENIGFAAAANQGAKTLKNTYILFLNPDAELQMPLASAIAYLDSHPRVAILGLRLLDTVGNPERFNYGLEVTPLTLFSRKWNQPASMSDVKGEMSAVRTAWVSGGAMIVRTALFQKIKGFDERFFLYWEDVDMCRRARQGAYEVVFFSDVSVLHRRGGSMYDVQNKAQIYDQSADKYFRKYYSTSICLLLRMARHIYRLFSPLAQ